MTPAAAKKLLTELNFIPGVSKTKVNGRHIPRRDEIKDAVHTLKADGSLHKFADEMKAAAEKKAAAK